jgi:hypothetical protein
MPPPETDDPLTALRERIRATAAAADRLAGQAAAAEPGDGPPPRTDEAAQEVQALVALMNALRDMIPAELRQQLNDLVRQVLLLVRAILDWWVDRLDSGRGTERAEPAVEDIPLD